MFYLAKRSGEIVECIFEKKTDIDLAEETDSSENIDYETLFNSTDAMIFIIDADDFSIGKINGIVEEKLNYTADELLGSSFLNLFALNSITEIVSNLKKVKSGKSKISGEFYFQRKDKSLIVGAVDANFVKGVAGKEDTISCLVRDVSKLKQFEKQVIQLERLLQIMKYVNRGIVEKNSIESLTLEIVKILSTSDMFSSVWIAVKTEDKIYSAERGYKKKINILDEIISRKMRINCIEQVDAMGAPHFVISPQAECLGCPYKDFYTGNGAVVLPLKYEDKDYGYLNVGLSYDFTMGDEERQFLYEIASDIAYAVNNLIKDEKERQYKQELIIHNTALEAAANGILITDIDGSIIFVNKAFTELTGYRSEEVIGANPRVLNSGEHSPEFYQNLWATILGGSVWRNEIINLRKDGTKYYEDMTITPVKNSEGEIINFIAIKQDITERKMIENELLKAKEEAEKSNRLKSEFLAQISHEIRTPINVLLSYSSLIEAELPEDINDDLKDSFHYMRSAGKRIVRTVDLILNMSEVLIGTYQFKTEKIDVCKTIIQPIFNEYRFSAEAKGLDLEFIHNEEDFLILGDEFSLQQVITNIVDNAIKYTEKGFVKIYCRFNENDKIVLTIEDSGIGIKDEYLKNIFELFSQEDQGYTRKFEGNGLGMALVKSYCNMNDVEINIESEKWKGTKIILTFNKTQK
ncbi:MAG: PAS domain S-box protein [Chlorobi bacterium]|nr:PAS domain S-box protein [Chlorobiota bacterium]